VFFAHLLAILFGLLRCWFFHSFGVGIFNGVTIVCLSMLDAMLGGPFMDFSFSDIIFI
jgi:hypothetical protein